MEPAQKQRRSSLNPTAVAVLQQAAATARPVIAVVTTQSAVAANVTRHRRDQHANWSVAGGTGEHTVKLVRPDQ